MTGAQKYNVPTDKKNAGTLSAEFYVHVTVHRNKFLYNKTNQTH